MGSTTPPLERTIRISRNGAQVTVLYGDGIEPLLDALGNPQVVRASHVRFDNDTGLWYIYMLTPCQAEQGEWDAQEEKLFPGFKTRKEAIEEEVRLCEARLQEEGDTTAQDLLRVRQIDQENHRVSG